MEGMEAAKNVPLKGIYGEYRLTLLWRNLTGILSNDQGRSMLRQFWRWHAGRVTGTKFLYTIKQAKMI